MVKGVDWREKTGGWGNQDKSNHKESTSCVIKRLSSPFELCLSISKSALNLRTQKPTMGTTPLKCLLFLSFHKLQASTINTSMNIGPDQSLVPSCNKTSLSPPLSQIIPSLSQHNLLIR